ncbi:MAG: histidine phosphatase family protein [Planctomycetes bacterium]|nr:histidine phosphatase family protein [Planctomycetota bacterium]
MTTKIIFVRHGEVYNPNEILYGRLPGFPLSEKGRGQISEFAGFVSENADVDGLYCSPLERALESAAIISSKIGISPVVDDRLIETGIPHYEGSKFGTLWDVPHTKKPGSDPNVEPFAEIVERMDSFSSEVALESPGKTIVAVSHRDPIAIYTFHLKGRDLAEIYRERFEVGEAVICTFGSEVKIESFFRPSSVD